MLSIYALGVHLEEEQANGVSAEAGENHLDRRDAKCRAQSNRGRT